MPASTYNYRHVTALSGRHRRLLGRSGSRLRRDVEQNDGHRNEMKSSAFGFLLAKLHFGAFAARVPSAVSVVWMALTGSSMAVAWRFMPVKPAPFDK